MRLWRRALVGARRISRASAFGKRHAFTACSSSSHKSFAMQNLCGSPAIGPPGCSVCAELICQQTIRAQTVCSTSGYALVRHGCGMLPQAGIPCSWRAQTPPPSNPCHIRVTENGADQSRLRFPWRRDRDYLRLFQQTKRQGFFERLDGFAAASVRSREPTAEKTAPHFRTIRRLWFKPALPHGKGLPKGSPFPWRRDRDLNPGRHHCLTRFRIVRVQPLRHLCIDGRRAPEMQTSFYRKSAKKATDFAPSREIFCWSIL